MSEESSSSLEQLFEALSNKHRRRLLVALLDHNSQDEAPVPETVHEGEVNLQTLQEKMFHNHLPMLEDAGFIEWDRDTHKVRRGPRFEEIEPLLQLIHDHADELPDDWI